MLQVFSSVYLCTSQSARATRLIVAHPKRCSGIVTHHASSGWPPIQRKWSMTQPTEKVTDGSINTRCRVRYVTRDQPRRASAPTHYRRPRCLPSSYRYQSTTLVRPALFARLPSTSRRSAPFSRACGRH